MSDVLSFTEFIDQLRIQGVNYKGFGILPKYVMLDLDLTIEAKTIYAYFCSFAGNGNSTFPGREKILSDLIISKDAYYKHFRQLTHQGYIVVEQEIGDKGTFSKNIYTLVSNPKKFIESEDAKSNLGYSRIRFSGLKATGFGIIPKAVMLDPRLPLKAKGIYAYFCSFTGSGNNAFPKKEKIFFHLGITHNTYQKFYKLLVELNYITAIQRHIDGRLSINDYYLIDMPDEIKAAKKTVLVASKQDTKKQDTDEINNRKQDTKKQDTEKQDTEKQDTNINNPNINNLNYTPSLSLSFQPAKPENKNERKDLLEEIVKKEITRNKALSYTYKADPEKMEAAIHFMTEWKIFFPSGYKDELRQRVYNLCNHALIEMCCADKPMLLKGVYVTYTKVIDKLNQLARFDDCYVDLSEFLEPAMKNYIRGTELGEIRNPLAYMKSCIWDAMSTGDIELYSDLHRQGY